MLVVGSSKGQLGVFVDLVVSSATGVFVVVGHLRLVLEERNEGVDSRHCELMS